jgi:hypothetical protein
VLEEHLESLGDGRARDAHLGREVGRRLGSAAAQEVEDLTGAREPDCRRYCHCATTIRR